MIASTARSMPRLRSIGFMPAATAFEPSLTIAAASTVAVVVPSPAMSDVLDATSRSICAPMFSNLSSSSISLATVTPSLVTRGAPKDFSSTTLRPFGPNVTLTASARMSTPRNMRSRASCENFTSLAAIGVYSNIRLHVLRPKALIVSLNRGLRRPMESGTSGTNPRSTAERAAIRPRRAPMPFPRSPKDVALFHDEQILTINLDFGARPLPERHAVTTLDVEGHDPAALITATRSRGDHLHVFFNPAHDHTIMQSTELHGLYLTLSKVSFCTSTAPAIGDAPEQLTRRAQ